MNDDVCQATFHTSRCTRLVEELAVGVRPEEGLSHDGQGAVLEQRQSCLEGVVNLDLAAPTNNQDTARAVLLFSRVSDTGNPGRRKKDTQSGAVYKTYLPSGTGFASSILALVSLPTFFLYSLDASSMALRTRS